MLLFNDKTALKIIGMMTGTSCDGLDLAHIEIDCETNKHSVLKCTFIAYPVDLKKRLLNSIDQLGGSFEAIKQLETDLSVWYSDQVNRFKEYDTDLIGMHGQTIYYRSPEQEKMGISWQLGSLSHIAKLTGLYTVGDFRNADIALMGQGAPLVPLYDFITYNDLDTNQLILNIGGICNGTFLKKDCLKEDVIAFDFGPGNCLIDLAMTTLFQKDYDQNGEVALSGKVDQLLVNQWINSEPYFQREQPKSTGREYFNRNYAERLIKECRAKHLDNQSIISSITAFTVDHVLYQLDLMNLNPTELIISGGGYKNQAIKQHFSEEGYQIRKLSENEADFKEAILLAGLAYNFIKMEDSTLTRVTGAKKATILGQLALP